MKKYLIYTINSTEPYMVETDRNLIILFERVIDLGEKTMYIQHKKDLIGTGTHKIDMLLNVNNIVSITTSEKV